MRSKIKKQAYYVIADADELVLNTSHSYLTQTPDGELRYLFDGLGVMNYSPVTNTCSKASSSHRRALNFSTKLKLKGISSALYPIV